jgi:uncharacterized protein (DUF433 family)
MCMNALSRITIDPETCGGRPCIRGLRVRVKDVLDLFAAGASREEILDDLPYLEAEDLDVVLTFAALQIRGLKRKDPLNEPPIARALAGRKTFRRLPPPAILSPCVRGG